MRDAVSFNTALIVVGVIILAIIVIMAGFGLYLRASLSGPDLGVYYSPLVRHATTDGRQHCYDNGLNYCEQATTPTFKKEAVLGFITTQDPLVPATPLYSCAGDSNNFAEGYDVTTDQNTCASRRLNPFLLGFLINDAAQVAHGPAVPIYRCTSNPGQDIVITDTAVECSHMGLGDGVLLGYAANSGHGVGWKKDALCEALKEECTGGNGPAICDELHTTCQLDPGIKPIGLTSPSPTPTPDPTPDPSVPVYQDPATRISQNKIEDPKLVEYAYSPQSTWLSNGGVLTAWSENTEAPGVLAGRRLAVKGRVFDPANGWSEVIDISPPTIDGKATVGVSDPRVLSDASGLAYVFWTQSVEGDPKCALYLTCQSLYMRVYRPGTGWEPVQLAQRITQSGVGLPEVAFVNDTKGIAVWQFFKHYNHYNYDSETRVGQPDHGKSDFFMAELNNGVMSTPVKIAELGNAAGTHYVKKLTNNKAVLVYTQEDGGLIDEEGGVSASRVLLQARIWENNQWSDPTTVTATDFKQVWGIPQAIYDLAVATDDQGNAAVAYTKFISQPGQINGYRTQARVIQLSAETGWGQEQILEDLGPGRAFDVKVAAVGNQEFVIAWNQMCDPAHSSKPPGRAIMCTYSTHSTSPGLWSPPTKVVSSNGQYGYKPGLMSDLAEAGNNSALMVVPTNNHYTMYRFAADRTWRPIVGVAEPRETGEGSVYNIISSGNSFLTSATGPLFFAWQQFLYRSAGLHSEVVRGHYLPANVIQSTP